VRPFRPRSVSRSVVWSTLQLVTLSVQGHAINKALNFLGWVKILHEGKETLCYPHEYKEGLKNARAMWDFPYRHGWY
jgi:hypothetical protein